MTDEEKRVELLFEQNFNCSCDIPQRQKNLLFNCLSETTLLKNTDIIELSLKDYRDCIKLNGSYCKDGDNCIVTAEIYLEGNEMSFALESSNLKTHKDTMILESFVNNDNMLFHYVYDEEGEKQLVGILDVKELDFVEREKAKIK